MIQTSPKVKDVFRAMIYTDAKGVEWRRGMDGWFSDMGDAVYLIRHEEMAETIDRESKDAGND